MPTQNAAVVEAHEVQRLLETHHITPGTLHEAAWGGTKRRILTDHTTVVVRLYTPTTPTLTTPAAEVARAHRLHQSGVPVQRPLLPTPLHLSSGTIVSVWEFIDGIPLASTAPAEAVTAAAAHARLLRKIHHPRHLTDQERVHVDPLAATQQRIDQLHHAGHPQAPDLLTLLTKAREVIPPTPTDELVLCHGDAHTRNTLTTTAGAVVFIDFDSTGPAHPIQDVASAVYGWRFWHPHPEAEQAVLDNYGLTSRDDLARLELEIWARRVRATVNRACRGEDVRTRIADLHCPEDGQLPSRCDPPLTR